MNQREIAALMAGIAPVVRDFCAKAMDGLAARIKAVEEREPVKGEPGTPGQDGKDGAVGADGKDGASGADGKAGSPGEPGTPGEKGVDGAAGRDGVDGKDGAPGLDGKDGSAGLPGEKGADGAPGRDGTDGANGKDGAPGIDGKDGAPGLRGEPGRDGRDASDLAVIAKMIGEQLSEQMTALVSGIKFTTPDDGRTFVLEMGVGEATARQEIKTAVLLDCGVWRPRDGGYGKGDGVTQGGSYFIAQKDTISKPDTPDSDWRLAVKMGRHGRDGKDGERGPSGSKGDRGEPGPRGFVS